MNENLEPCPFCQSTDIDILTYDEEYHTRKVAECINCGARGSISDSDEEAIESWNTRPLEDEKDKQIKKLLQTLNEIQNLTCFPQNKSAVCDKMWNISRSAIRDYYFGKDPDVLANPTDNNVGNMEE